MLLGGLASTAGLVLADDDVEDMVEEELSEHSVVVELESSSISDDDADEDALFRSLALGVFETAVAAAADDETNAAEGSSLGGVLDRRFFWDRLSDGDSAAALLDSGADEVGLGLVKPPLNLDVKSFHVLLNAPAFPLDILALDLPPDFFLEPLP